MDEDQGNAAPGSETPLRDSEEPFRLLVEQVRDYAIFMLDPDGHVVSWNEGAERLKGYRADEIIGQHFSRFYPIDDVRRGKCERELEVATAEGRIEDESWRIRKDGSRFWANVVITALRDPDGQLRGFAKVTRDLTDRKRAEDSLRGVLEREREVADRLRAMDKTKDEILAVVAHDLRGPLTVLDGMLETLDDGWDALSSDAKREAIRRMASSTARLRVLVNDVMDVTRIDTGDLRFNIDAFDADALAAGVVADIAGPDAARVRVEPSATGAAMAWGDEGRAWQVLANLLSNALKFSAVDYLVHMRVVDTESGEVRFEVEDYGPGVPLEERERIFEKFSRATATPTAGEGTGLGLYIARSLATGQGGRLHVESELGEGSTFTFVLPKAGGELDPAGEGETAEAEAPSPSLRSVDRPEPPASARRARGRRHRSVARSGARRRWTP